MLSMVMKRQRSTTKSRRLGKKRKSKEIRIDSNMEVIDTIEIMQEAITSLTITIETITRVERISISLQKLNRN